MAIPLEKTPIPTYVAMVKTFSWPAIFAGVVLALTVQIVLSMLGTGIGMSTIDPQTAESPSLKAFSIGAGLWWVVSSFVALVAGGFVAGEVSGLTRARDGAMHGLVMWGLATLIGVYLVGSVVGATIAGASKTVSSAISGTASGLGRAAPQMTGSADLSWESVKGELQNLMGQGKPKGNGQMDPQLLSAVKNLLDQGEGASEADREVVINMIATQTGMTHDEAANQLQTWQRKYEDARKKAREIADDSAKVAAQLALWGCLTFVLGAIAAALGGIAGTASRADRVEKTRLS